MVFHRFQLVTLIFAALLVSCKPADEAASSRSRLDAYAGTQNSNEVNDEDPMMERPADVSIPVSGTNLIFSVGKGADLASLDAYIVGYVDQLTVTRLADQQFAIYGVPPGEQEIIVTGLSSAEPGTNLGVRLPILTQSGTPLDMGVIDLPKTGGLQGLAEMEGIAQFSTITLRFPGTKIPSLTPDSFGRYALQNLPVGTHKLAWQHKDSQEPIKAEAKIATASVTQKSSRDLVRSTPNSPSNLIMQSSDNNVALSWISGGGNPTGYLVYRGGASDSFKPVHGQAYPVGALGNGFVVAAGSGQSIKDSGLVAGNNYTYRIYAYNKDLVYSAPRSGSITASASMAAYRRYRFHVNSVANNCQTQGTAQIQALNFYIDKAWQINDFTSNTNTGRIGPYPVTVAVNNKYNSAYDAFYAFQDDNLAWSSSFKSYNQNAPFDVLTNKEPDGIYFDIDFGSTAVSIEGLEILGGEPPFYPECSPDDYHLLGSNDGTNWTTIPGSARSENTEARLRYYFQNENRPLSPLQFKLLGNEGQIQLSWASAAGAEVGYLLARSRMPEPFAPENGRSYGVGTVEGYEILVDGAQLSYLDTSFEDLQSPYYYTVLSYDASRQYSPSIIGRAVPEKRPNYRYYRFVVLSILGGGPAMSWMESLKLQINGNWVDQYAFSSMQGTIAGNAVTLSESSANGTNHAYGLFTNGYWQTSKPTFNTGGMVDAIKKSGEYVQLDFGNTPVAITGFRGFGNSATDDSGRYSSSMYYQVPDLIRMERSQDGQQWEIIEGSVSGHSLAQEVDMVW